MFYRTSCHCLHPVFVELQNIIVFLLLFSVVFKAIPGVVVGCFADLPSRDLSEVGEPIIDIGDLTLESCANRCYKKVNLFVMMNTSYMAAIVVRRV